jgi:hypothetical protein
MGVRTTTFPKRVNDVMPGQLVETSAGRRLRVIGNERVDRWHRRLHVVDVNTGEQLAPWQLPTMADVRIVEIER